MPPEANRIARVIEQLDVTGLTPREIRHQVVLAAGRHGCEFQEIVFIIDGLERRTGLRIHDYEAAQEIIAKRHRRRTTKMAADGENS